MTTSKPNAALAESAGAASETEHSLTRLEESASEYNLTPEQTKQLLDEHPLGAYGHGLPVGRLQDTEGVFQQFPKTYQDMVMQLMANTEASLDGCVLAMGLAQTALGVLLQAHPSLGDCDIRTQLWSADFPGHPVTFSEPAVFTTIEVPDGMGGVWNVAPPVVQRSNVEGIYYIVPQQALSVEVDAEARMFSTLNDIAEA